jgi:hypothetical protein
VVTLPWPSFRMDFGRPIFISIAGKIFMFINDTHYLGDPPPPPQLRPTSGGEFLPSSRRRHACRSRPAAATATPCTLTAAPWSCPPASGATE